MVKRILIYVLLWLMWLLLGLWSLSLGGLFSWSALLSSLFHKSAVPHMSAIQWQVLWQLRLPRVVVLSGVGASLSWAGVLMQGLFRNPLADPGLLGISAGAALSVMLGLVCGLPLWLNLNGMALIGALIILLSLCVFSWLQPGRHSALLLCGVALGALCGAVSSLVLYLSSSVSVQSALHWSFGGVDSPTWPFVMMALGVWVLAAILSFMSAPGLDVWGLGDETAKSLGLNVHRLTVLSVLAVALAVAAAVALVGPIAFVGLIVPHAARMAVGAQHRRLLCTVSLLGPVLMLAADGLCRIIHSPMVLPLGIATALLGAPVFIALLLGVKYAGAAGSGFGR